MESPFDRFLDEPLEGWSPDPATRNLQRRQAAHSFMEAARAYTPATPIANPDTMEEIKPPCPVAVNHEHEIVCKAIDACDEYCGDLSVTPDPAFLCPVSHIALRDPVAAPDGHVYEKTFIETSKKAASVRMVEWTSPMTRMQWDETTAFPRSASTVLAMSLWVKLKAFELAGARAEDNNQHWCVRQSTDRPGQQLRGVNSVWRPCCESVSYHATFTGAD